MKLYCLSQMALNSVQALNLPSEWKEIVDIGATTRFHNIFSAVFIIQGSRPILAMLFCQNRSQTLGYDNHADTACKNRIF